MKKEYIKAIVKELEKCNDIAVIDFMYQLIVKLNKKHS